ncbi:MAG: DUF6122 family protein [Candidatus Helarchaeota archaeon]
MHLHVHFSQGLIVAMLFFPYLSFIELLIVVGFPFLIDLDFFFSKFAKNNNHRRLITHSLVPYIPLLIIGIFFPVVLALGIGAIIHILTDTIDWGTALLTPFYKEPIGGILPLPPKEIIEIPNYRKRQCWFATTYYKNSILVIIELIFGVTAILLIVLINIWVSWLLLFYFLFVALQLRFNLYCRKNQT